MSFSGGCCAGTWAMFCEEQFLQTNAVQKKQRNQFCTQLKTWPSAQAYPGFLSELLCTAHGEGREHCDHCQFKQPKQGPTHSIPKGLRLAGNLWRPSAPVPARPEQLSNTIRNYLPFTLRTTPAPPSISFWSLAVILDMLWDPSRHLQNKGWEGS